jgi:uncharacterized paraquat-inducible protein A
MCVYKFTFRPGSVVGLDVWAVIWAGTYKEAERKVIKYVYLNKIGKFEPDAVCEKCDYFFLSDMDSSVSEEDWEVRRQRELKWFWIALIVAAVISAVLFN